MKFSFLKDHRPQKLSLKKVCKAFEVSSSGYFKFLKTKSSHEKEYRESKVVEIFHFYNEKGGYRKVFHQLRKTGEDYSLYEVRKILSSKNLRAKKAKSFKPQTTDSCHNNPISPRVFKTENTELTKINQVWSTDITYLPVEGTFVYLVLFLDVYSRKILSWSLSPSLSADFVLEAFLKALQTRCIPPGLVVHSDRGGFSIPIRSLGEN